MSHTVSIAIDGPSAAGKSTIARALAERLGFLYVDTGALYRAIGYFAHTDGADLTDAAAIEMLLPRIDVRLIYLDGVQRILLNGQDVSEAIRLPEMSMAASSVSALPSVRAFLLELQRSLAREHNVVMDGRDIGTVVLPHASVKFFLTASPEVRAHRRQREFLEKGQSVAYEKLLAETIQRDHNDSSRAAAPLRQSTDAVLIDSTALSLEETIEWMDRLARKALAKAV